MKQKKINGKSVGIELLVLVVAILLTCSLLALLIEKQVVPELVGRLMSIGLAEVLVMVLGYRCARRVPQNRLLAAMAPAGVFLVIRLLIHVIAFAGEGMQLYRCLITLAAAAAAGIMASTKKQHRR